MFHVKQTSNTQHLKICGWKTEEYPETGARLFIGQIHVDGIYMGAIVISQHHSLTQHTLYYLDLLTQDTLTNTPHRGQHFDSLPDLCHALREHFDDQRPAQLLL